MYKECDESGDKEEKERDVIKEERNICRSNERLRRFIRLLEKITNTKLNRRFECIEFDDFWKFSNLNPYMTGFSTPNAHSYTHSITTALYENDGLREKP